jgi:uncharacterized protein YeaO (DUF488 family)
MKTDLKIYTGFVSPVTVPELIKNNYLPIFIIRSIKNSQVIGKYEGTTIHFKELAPSYELFHELRDGKIGREEFEKRYIIEISKINLFETVKKLDYLAKLSNAKGVVLMGYGSDRNKCHRSILGSMLFNTGALKNPVKELVL